MNDILWRGIAINDSFRIFAVDATNTAQQARDLHDLSPVATILMGKMICATALLSLDLKSPDSEVSLRVDGEGPLEGGLVICDAKGNIRGYMRTPSYQAKTAQDNFYPGRLLGDGTMTVIKKLPGAAPWMGSTALVTGEIAEDLAHFYMQSEQVPSAVSLGILIDPDAKVRACAGFVIQQLPFADPAKAEALIHNLNQTPNLSDLMDMGLTIEEVFARFVFKDMEYRITADKEIRYHCNCSKERFARSLITLGRSEILELREGVEPVCHYCNQTYHFTPEDIDSLLIELDSVTQADFKAKRYGAKEPKHPDPGGKV